MSNLVPSKGPKFQQTLLLTQKEKKKNQPTRLMSFFW